MPPTQATSAIGLLIPTLLQNDLEGWRNTGWAGVTQTTADLLSYWFEEDCPGPQFHECQRHSRGENLIMRRLDPRRDLTPKLQQLLTKYAMEATKRRVLQLIASSQNGNGINDQQIADQLKISLDESRFHLDDLYGGGFIKLICSKTYMNPEGRQAVTVTPQGKMILEGKISFEDGHNSSPNSQIFKVTNQGSVANQQFGNNNSANVSQNIGSDAAEILQMLHALRQDVSSLPPERQTVAIEALADIEAEVTTPTRASRIPGGLLLLWRVTKDIASTANAVTALAQRFGIDHLLS